MDWYSIKNMIRKKEEYKPKTMSNTERESLMDERFQSLQNRG